MNILAVESSCDETSCAIVTDGRTVRSNIVASQIEEHRLYGGVVPEIASRRHAECISQVCSQALSAAELEFSDIDGIAVTYAPGLIGALLTGLNFAKGLSMSLSKPLIAVHHLRGHIAANYIATPSLAPPFLCLVVSGGHSHIIEVLSHTEFKIVGKTLDDAAGEAFDKVARVLGMPYPGGVFLDKAAVNGNIDAYPLPRPKLHDNDYDFSFSGLKTAVINLAHNLKQKGESLDINDMAASFTEAVVDILSTKAVRAAEDLSYNKLVCAGGVIANSHLRKRLDMLCSKKNIELVVPPLELCGDNAAMIASQGYFEYLAGNICDLSLNAYPSLPIDANVFNL